MKSTRRNAGVSEILGNVLLLGFAISLFSVLYAVVLSYPFPPSPPSVNLIGTVKGDQIILEHLGGESLSLDSQVILTIAGRTTSIPARNNVTDSNGDGYWNVGEAFVYKKNSLLHLEVRVTVVDRGSNSVVMTGLLQHGI